ncbi:hypothetical protein GCM10010404_48490 [Nonomuraea africana]|uniref:DNA repair exonuclease SbcCD ATPase subunit n=1 Tax=Nonomuraea africana TaxID=46171 RepID=A0ABR9KW11_9ACTN|nr:hypothetical protein [Nonomuraea africana]MBE1566185.1 DNA repair exonuclease SbcCD ATPase subunit [Nonomuraea africana]
MTDFASIDEQLRVAQERARYFGHLTRQRGALTGQIQQVRQAIADLEARLAEEERDVTRLEGGFVGFLAKLAGSKEERLAQERIEVEAARQRLHGQRARLAALEGDLEGIDAERMELAGAVEEYARLMGEKERLLIELDGDPRGTELAELAGRLGDRTADLREHDEAHRAGVVAGEELAHVLERLSSARGASTWDMLGGGYVADSIERNRLQQADEAAWRAQRALDVFARELADIGVAVSPQLPQVDTRWFVDTFFDNIVTDVLKHQRITRTRDAVAEAAQWVRTTVDSIARRSAELSAERTALLARRNDLLAPGP